MSKTREEYMEKNAEIAALYMGVGLDRFAHKQLAKRGWSTLGVFTPLVLAKYSVEATGLTLAYMINGDEGVEDWMEFSNTVYDWGYLGEIPIVGSVLETVPNPIAMHEMWMDTGVAIAEDGFRTSRNLQKRDIMATRRYYDSWIPDFLK
jgi:hypothetical protein